jgi:hypothetical protein
MYISGCLRCRKCKRRDDLDYYRRNKSTYRKREIKYQTEKKTFVNTLKNNTPCKDCGILYPNEPWLKEFDHLHSKTKMVSDIVRNGSMSGIKKEIEKCDIVCLICHKRRTAMRAKWRTYIDDGSNPV